MTPDPTRPRRRASVLVVVCLLLGVACGQSEMVQSWTNPTPPGTGYGRILVIALMPSEGDRQIFESEFVKRFEQFDLDAVPSYRHLSPESLNLDSVRALVQRENFTTVFLVETLTIDQATTSWVTGGQSSRSIPAEEQRSFGSTYENAHDTMLDGPNTSVTTIATIQSSIYHVPTEDLLWRGTSRTYDPGPAAKIVPPLSHMIVRTIQRAHIY